VAGRLECQVQVLGRLALDEHERLAAGAEATVGSDRVVEPFRRRQVDNADQQVVECTTRARALALDSLDTVAVRVNPTLRLARRGESDQQAPRDGMIRIR